MTDEAFRMSCVPGFGGFKELIEVAKGNDAVTADRFQRFSDYVAEQNPGYHLREIEKGVVGESSKIREEVEELLDAEAQGVSIMALVELSDLYGAIQAYLEKHHPGTTMDDLRAMSDVTKRAFRNGRR